MTRIAAVFILKNEAHVIERALDSLYPGIDEWIALDTGSTDDTIATLQRYGERRPGRIRRGPFVDFSDARNRLLDLAEPLCDWFVILDGDMEWVDLPVLRQEITNAPEHIDGFSVKIGDQQTYWQVRAMRAGRGWRYKYRAHELAVCPTMRIGYSQSRTVHHADGGSREDRIERDLRLLGLDLADDPTDPVTHYYLGGTYLNAGNPRAAMKHYRRSIRFNPDPTGEPTYISRYSLAQAQRMMGMAAGEVDRGLLEAAQTRPWRREALAELLRRLNDQLKYAAVLELWEIFGPEHRAEPDRMFVDESADASCRFEVARAAYATGSSALLTDVVASLREDPSLPANLAAVLDRTWPAIS